MLHQNAALQNEKIPNYPFEAYSLATNYANMTMHYLMAYSLASIKPFDLPRSFGLNQLDWWWVQRTTEECFHFLKLPVFSMSVTKNISSLARINDTFGLGGNPIQKEAEKTWRNFRDGMGSMLEAEESRQEIVMHQDDIRLLHYLPRKDVLHSVPLLTVYAPINRYHIMDIRKGRSVVEHFVQAGFDVFLLDWGPQIHNRPTIDDYLMYIDSSIASIKKSTGAPKVSLLGYSWGGVLSCIYASLIVGQQNVQNLVLQSAHVDFDKDDSILASWFRKFPASEIRKKFESIDTSSINLALVMRNPAIHLQDA